VFCLRVTGRGAAVVPWMISIISGQASSTAISSAVISSADIAGAPATSSTTTRARSPPPHHSQCARFMALKLPQRTLAQCPVSSQLS
jgi:hypothetical protein